MRKIILIAVLATGCSHKYEVQSAVNPAIMAYNWKMLSQGKVYLHRCYNRIVLFTDFNDEGGFIGQRFVTFRNCVVGEAEQPKIRKEVEK